MSKGYLRDLARGVEITCATRNRMEPHYEDNVRTIHFIHGEPKRNGASNNARKRYISEVHRSSYIYTLQKGSSYALIIFTNKDETTSLYKDHLVITLRIGLCDVYMILIDIESLMNTIMQVLGIRIIFL